MKSSIFIPKKIKVGFNPRKDTYTGRLGYVIYHDGKVWRKETSWKGWIYEYTDNTEFEKRKRDQYDGYINTYTNQHASAVKWQNDNPSRTDSWYTRVSKLTLEDYLNEVLGPYDKFQHRLGRVSDDPGIVPVEYDNTPLEGFVLNKKAGGTSSGWNHRQTYCRVYDPRGFEFEITIPNLLYILENASSFKGKGLEGKFIYGWDGKDLLLIPEDAPEYKDMVEFTEILGMKVSKKDLVVGKMYMTAQGEKVTFLAEAPEYNYDRVATGNTVLWFYNNDKTYSNFVTKPVTALKKCIGDDPSFVNLLDKLEKDKYFKPEKIREYVYTPVHPDTIKQISYNTTLFLQKGKSYIEMYVYKREYPRPTTYSVGSRKRADAKNFTSAEELLKEYPLFKRSIQDEKVSK